MNVVILNVYMFCASIKNCVMGQNNEILVITLKKNEVRRFLLVGVVKAMLLVESVIENTLLIKAVITSSFYFTVLDLMYSIFGFFFLILIMV